MCEFCLKHGEGKKWYLQAANYSEDLLSDMRRRNFIQQFFGDLDALSRQVARLDDLDKAPGFVRRVIRWKTARSFHRRDLQLRSVGLPRHAHHRDPRSAGHVPG
jgi:hypothetical protein